MIRQGFSVGDKRWYVMGYYDVKTEKDFEEVRIALLSSGCDKGLVEDAVENLRLKDSGFTFTNKKEKNSIIFVSESTSPEQAYDTIQHELKHVVEHISEAYGVDPSGEESAYLQGEIARNMFKATAFLYCPYCNGKNFYRHDG